MTKESSLCMQRHKCGPMSFVCAALGLLFKAAEERAPSLISPDTGCHSLLLCSSKSFPVEWEAQEVLDFCFEFSFRLSDIMNSKLLFQKLKTKTLTSRLCDQPQKIPYPSLTLLAWILVLIFLHANQGGQQCVAMGIYYLLHFWPLPSLVPLSKATLTHRVPGHVTATFHQILNCYLEVTEYIYILH